MSIVSAIHFDVNVIDGPCKVHNTVYQHAIKIELEEYDLAHGKELEWVRTMSNLF